MSHDLIHHDDDQPPDTEETFAFAGGPGSEIERIYRRFVDNQSPFGFQPRDQTLTYHPLPYLPADEDQLMLATPWRLVLELQVDDRPLRLGIDLYGDITLGRGSSRPSRLILDLTEYGAKDRGVSREHALLRPTVSRLYLIDLGSTNQTFVNSVPSGRGVATTLTDKAMITLGTMVIVLHIVEMPAS